MRIGNGNANGRASETAFQASILTLLASLVSPQWRLLAPGWCACVACPPPRRDKHGAGPPTRSPKDLPRPEGGGIWASVGGRETWPAWATFGDIAIVGGKRHGAAEGLR